MTMRLHLILCASVAMSAPGCVLFSNVTFNGGSAADGSAMDGATTDTAVPDSSLVCPANRRDCDGVAANGCETPESASSCGPTCAACNLPNATAMCSNGACAIQTCLRSRMDCNNTAADGCETDISSDANHCGACGTGCMGATPICVAGRCVAECPTGFTLCNGACVNFTTDPTNCGSCGNRCRNTGVGNSVCVAGTCDITCPEGFSNCDSNAANGCESLAAPTRCGACGMTCGGAGPICRRDSERDPAACVLSTLCATSTRCGDSCVNVSISTEHCGSCNNSCNAPNRPGVCTSGACVANTPCTPGFADCNGDASDGCETSLRDINNCGRCGARCVINNGLGQCVPAAAENTFECRVASCQSGFASCDSDPSNGCEANLRTDVTNCGGCGMACAVPPNKNATGATCSAGRCAAVCAGGFADCDGNIDNGCEVDLSTAGNCGACGADCATLCGTNSAASCVVRTNGNRCQCSN